VQLQFSDIFCTVALTNDEDITCRQLSYQKHATHFEKMC